MITNVQLTHISISGTHARFTYDLDGVPTVFSNVYYDDFWGGNAEYNENPEYEDLKFLLEQLPHASWAELKINLET